MTRDVGKKLNLSYSFCYVREFGVIMKDLQIHDTAIAKSGLFGKPPNAKTPDSRKKPGVIICL
jgi:hypothetical protein